MSRDDFTDDGLPSAPALPAAFHALVGHDGGDPRQR
jgi:hypothetical protein